MLRRLLNAGAWAFTASFCLGGLLLYGTGGWDSPDVTWVLWTSAITLPAFWLVFTILIPAPPIDENKTSGEGMEG